MFGLLSIINICWMQNNQWPLDANRLVHIVQYSHARTHITLPILSITTWVQEIGSTGPSPPTWNQPTHEGPINNTSKTYQGFLSQLKRVVVSFYLAPTLATLDIIMSHGSLTMGTILLITSPASTTRYIIVRKNFHEHILRHLRVTRYYEGLVSDEATSLFSTLSFCSLPVVSLNILSVCREFYPEDYEPVGLLNWLREAPTTFGKSKLPLSPSHQSHHPTCKFIMRDGN